MIPGYDLEKIKLGVDEKTWERALALYEGGGVSEFEESYVGFTGVVLGTKPYDVAVSERWYDRGDCNCFVGQRGHLCKHMVALAIYAVLGGLSLGRKQKNGKRAVRSPKMKPRRRTRKNNNAGLLKKTAKPDRVI